MQPTFFIRPEVRSLFSAEGTVLLDLRSGKYFALNSTGSLVWSRLEAGEGREKIEQALRERFSGAGEVGADLDALLSGLHGRGLIGAEPPTRPSPPAPLPPLLSPSLGEGRRTGLSSLPPPLPGRVGGVVGEEGRGGEGRGGGLTLAAFAALLLTDLTLKAFGFPRCSRLLAWTRRTAGPADPGRVARICASVDVASRFYFKRAWCLQRSMAATLLLRWAGQPADLVIGVRRFPFLAHAWVEVEGRVVNDDSRVKPTFPEMVRC